MASLTGQLVAETYKALLKTIDNDILTASEKQITDGLGGGSNVFIDSQGFLRANKYKVTNGLATQFLKADGSLDANTYLTGITSSQIITALGYTPVPTTRTLTINGTTYDLSANRSWTVAGTAAVWGNITGTLSNQTDLQTALNAKFNNPTGTISQYIRGDGSLATFPTLPGGLPTGGTAGQILAKIDATDYNTHWIDNFATQTKNEVKLGATLAKGTAVYVSGSTGGSGTNMIVMAASNASEALSSKTFGLLETGGATNDFVKCVTFGLIAGLDTSTAQAGDPVWLGVNGALLFGVANKPVAPANMVYIGVVTRVQSNNGEIFVNVQNGFEIEELHDVLITSKANNQGLFYESSTGLWKNKSIATVLGYTPQAQLNGTGLVRMDGTTVSYDNNPYPSGSGSIGYIPVWNTTTGLSNSSLFQSSGSIGLNITNVNYSAYGRAFTGASFAASSFGYEIASGATADGGLLGGLAYVLTENDASRRIGAKIESNVVGTTATNLGANLRFYVKADNAAIAEIARMTASGVTFYSGITATSFIKTGGTSNEYLRADGSVNVITGDIISGSGTAGYIAKFNSSAVIASSNLFESSANIGFGTITLNYGSYGRAFTGAGFGSTAFGFEAVTGSTTNGGLIGGLSLVIASNDSTRRIGSAIQSYISGATSTHQGADLRFFVKPDNGVLLEVVRMTSAGITFNKDLTAANITATTFVKSGGLSTQFLMADGSVSTLSSPVTGSGSTGYIPKWTTAANIGSSIIYEDISIGIAYTTPNRGGYGRTLSGAAFGSASFGFEAVSNTTTNGGLIGGLSFIVNQNDSSRIVGSAIQSNLVGTTATNYGADLRFFAKADGVFTIAEVARMTSAGLRVYGTIVKDGGTGSQFLMADGSVTTGVANPVSGTGTTNYLSKWTSGNVIGNSIAYDNGSGLVAGTGTINSIPSWMKFISTDTTQSGIGSVFNNKAIYIYNSGTNIKLDAYDYGTNTALDVQIGGNGGNILMPSGSLLIGGPNPSLYAANSLVVYANKTGNAGISIDNALASGSATTSLFLYNAGNLKMRFDYNRTDDTGIIGSAASIPLTFWTNNSSKMMLTSTGLLGINCTPSYRLHVVDNLATWASVVDNSNGIESVSVYNAHGGGYGLAIDSTSNDTKYIFKAMAGTGGTGKGSVPVIYAMSNGKVGINTSNPAYFLDVNGTANFSGAITGANATFTGFNQASNFVSDGTSFYAISLKGRSLDNYGAIGFYSNNGATRTGYIQYGTVFGGQVNITGDGGASITLDNRGVNLTGAATFASSIQTTNLLTTSMSGSAINIRGDNSLNSNFGITWTTSTYTGGIAAIRVARTGSTDAADMMFFTSPNGDIPNQRMILTSGGALIVGASSMGYAPTIGYVAGFKSAFTGQSIISIARAGQTLATQGLIVGIDSSQGFLWARDNVDLVLANNDTARVTIKSNGCALVSSDTSLDPVFKLQVGNGSADTRALFNSNNPYAVSIRNGASSLWYLGVNAQTASNGFQLFSNQGGVAMTLTTGNLIGLSGNTTPEYRIDLCPYNAETPTDVIRFGVNNGPSGGGGNALGTGIIWKPFYAGYTRRSAGIMQIAENNYFRAAIGFFTNDNGNQTSDWSERFRIHSAGNATFYSYVTATAFFESSDIRLKKLINGSPQIDGIENLKAKLYEKNGKMELGYFAQDAEKIMPYAVTKNADGFLSLSYREVHTAKIARLEQRVAELEKQLNLN